MECDAYLEAVLDAAVGSPARRQLGPARPPGGWLARPVRARGGDSGARGPSCPRGPAGASRTVARRGRPPAGSGCWRPRGDEQAALCLQRFAALAGCRGGKGGGEQVTRLSILIRIGHVVSTQLTVESLLVTVDQEVARVFDTTNFYVAVRQARSEDWLWAFHREHGDRLPATSHPLHAGLTGCIFRTAKPLFLPVYREREAWLRQEGVETIGEIPKAWMGVPLIAGDAVIGRSWPSRATRRKASTRKATWSSSRPSPPRSAWPSGSAQLYEDATRHALEMEALASIGRDLNASLDLDTVLARIAANVQELLARDTLAIFLESDELDVFLPVANLRTRSRRGGRPPGPPPGGHPGRRDRLGKTGAHQ